MGPLALTATVPLAFGKVTVVLALGALGTKLMLLPLVLFLKTNVPLVVLATPRVTLAEPAVPTFRLPPTVTRPEPLSATIESAMLPELVNLDSLPGVPPVVVTLPPTPAQLPAVVQTL